MNNAIFETFYTITIKMLLEILWVFFFLSLALSLDGSTQLSICLGAIWEETSRVKVY